MRCYAIGCKKQAFGKGIMCRRHWGRLPIENRMEIADAWRPKRQRSDRTKRDYFIAVVRAVNTIGLMEDMITFEEAIYREDQAEKTYRRYLEDD